MTSLPSFDLPSAIQACEEAIRLNESASVDRVGRYILDAKSARLKQFMGWAKIELATPHNLRLEHLFGENWHGPALDDLLKSSAYHREHSAVRKVRAA